MLYYYIVDISITPEFINRTKKNIISSFLKNNFFIKLTIFQLKNSLIKYKMSISNWTVFWTKFLIIISAWRIHPDNCHYSYIFARYCGIHSKTFTTLCKNFWIYSTISLKWWTILRNSYNIYFVLFMVILQVAYIININLFFN